VELGYQPQVPPVTLYHGTAAKNKEAIFAKGLHKGSRHHVHLSTDRATAMAVGQRHGKPIVLQVAASRMHQDGFVFYQSENGVWLTDAVPPDYLELVP
jgi:putative RNA 2'-phosphotransferase